MKSRVKFKILSLLTILTMVVNVLQIPTFAAWTDDTLDTSNSKGFFVSALEEDQVPAITTVVVQPDESGNGYTEVVDPEIQAGDTVYIALKAKNFSNYAKNSNGAFLVTTALVFDKRYLAPAYTSKSNLRTTAKSDLTKFGDQCFYNKTSNGSFELLSTYDVSSTSANLNATMSNDDTAIALLGATDTTNLQKITYSIEYTPDDSENEDELAAVIDDNSYIAIYRFTVNSDLTANTSSLGVTLSRSGNIGLTLGNGSTSFSKSYAQTDGLHKYLVLEDGVNLFPAYYSVNFYNDSDFSANPISTVENVKENTKLLATQIPDESKFTSTDPTKVYDKLLYTTAETADETSDKEFTSDVNITADTKVYAHYVTGAKVTFLNDKNLDPETAENVFATKYAKPDGISTLGADNMPKDSEGNLINPEPPAGKAFGGWVYDNNGTETEFKADETVIPEEGLVVYPTWTDQVTVKYSVEGTIDEAKNDAGKPEDSYTLPSTNPEKTDYTFVGWNTKPNGAGSYIGTEQDTYAKVLAEYQKINPDEKSTVILYAQFADVKDPTTDPDKIKDEPEQPADPADNGVRVKFDSNAGDDTTVVDAKPLYKYPKIDDTISGDNMPDVPTRDHYVCTSWNTLPSGGGTSFATDADLTITSDMIAEGSNEVVLYAQWDVNPEDPDVNDNKITVNFNKNTASATDPKPATREVWNGDTLVNLPEPPTQDGFKFMGWFLDENASSTIDENTSPDVTAETVIDKTLTQGSDTLNLYAAWRKPLKLVIEYRKGGVKVDPVYDGTPKTPEIVQIFAQDENGDYTVEVTGTTFTDYKSKITLKYIHEDADPDDPSIDNPTNAGTYNYDITVDADLLDKGIDVAESDPGSYTISPMPLDFKIENQQARYAGTAGAAPATITVTTEGKTDFTDFTATYKKLALPEGSNEIIVGTLGPATTNPTAASFADISSIGKYVIELSITNKNYEVGQITPTNAVYPKTADAAGDDGLYYPGADPKNAIKYEIIPNDPKATGLAVTKEGEDRATQALTLTDSDYETTKAFTSDDEATTDEAKKNHYWVTVDKDTDAVDIYVDAETYYTVKINGDNEDTLTNGTAKDTVSNLRKTIEIDENGVITKTDVDNVIPIKVESAGSDPKEYTIHVRRLADAQATDLKFTEKDNPDNIFGLKDNTYETDKEFKPDDTEYWVRVPKDKDSIDVLVSALGQGDKKITINGTQVTPDANGVAKANVADLKQAVETNEDGTLKRGDNGDVIVNTPGDITVVIGEGDDAKTYTIHIQRLGEGGFALNYGNSPYGEIMRADNITDKEAAKTAFISGSDDGYKYSNEYLPSGIKYGASFFYSQTVWANEETNMDLDDTALFVFMFKDLVDPGFTAKDSSGNEVAPEDITRSITVKTVASENLNNSMTTRDPFTTDGQAANDTFPYLSLAGDMEARIVPGVYTLTYSFHDEALDNDVTAERNVIVLPMMGDVNIDGGITTVDANPINIQSVTTHSNLNQSDISSYNLMVYRVFDVNGDGGVTTVDVNPVNIRSVSATWADAGYAEYYREFTK